MNTQTKTPKRKPLRAFQAWPENERRLAIASQLGINVSELINEALEANLEKSLEKKIKNVQSALKMVRARPFI